MKIMNSILALISIAFVFYGFVDDYQRYAAGELYYGIYLTLIAIRILLVIIAIALVMIEAGDDKREYLKSSVWLGLTLLNLYLADYAAPLLQMIGASIVKIFFGYDEARRLANP